MTGAVYAFSEAHDLVLPVYQALQAVVERVALICPASCRDLKHTHPQLSALEAANPLAGLREALMWAQGDDVLYLAGDLQQPSSELLRYMQHVQVGYEAVVTELSTGEIQPLLALYSTRCQSRVAALLGAGSSDLGELLPTLQAYRLSEEELAKFGSPSRLLSRRTESLPR
jgi:molybdopterin-guanine dinucleotide biosynthesis protein A